MTGKLIGRLGVLLLIGAIGHAQAQTDEENVGKAGAAQVLGGAALVVSPQSQQYVNLVGNAVAKQSGSNYKWHFGVENLSPVYFIILIEVASMLAKNTEHT